MAKRKTPKKKMVLEDAVEKFIASAKKNFSTDEAVSWIKPMLRALPTRLREAVSRLLRRHSELYFDDAQDRYVLRRLFFRGGKFVVSPTADEVRDGILFPGHRFVPYVARNVFPPSCKLTLPDGTSVRHKVVTRQLNDLLIYFSMFGLNGIVEYLLTDQESNSTSLSRGPETTVPVTVTVFNMKKAYKQFAFQLGDALLLTIDDWGRGRFSVAHLPASSVEAQEFRRKVWCRNLDKALLEVFNEFGCATDVDEQLAQAFFVSSENLLESPLIHVGGYLATSKTVEMVPTQAGTILWRAGESPEDDMFADFETVDEDMVGRRDSLAAILGDVGLSLTETEIDAYMRDELFSGDRDPDAVLERCLAGRGLIQFADRDQEKAFLRFFNKMWLRVCRTYVPANDNVNAPLRAHALAIIDKHLRWMRNCDQEGLTPADLPPQDAFQLAVKSGVLSNILESLQADDMDQDSLEHLPGLLLEIESDVDAVIASISGSTGKANRSQFRVLEGGKAAFNNVYQLKITLQGIRPPIWRRIQVPETTTLSELHITLQAAMGWQVSHLHQFTFGDMRYGPTDYDDWSELHYDDEVGVALASLVSKQGDMFSYEYDFGDGWDHAVTVEKILPAKSGAVYPRCVTGKRACPPEDCGGVWGYENLLSILRDPSHEEHEERIEWAGGDIDPEEFDVKETNLRISDYKHEFN